MSLTAFFLCAGYGQRLRPLTERIAKPAIPFLGQSAFEINVLNVRRADALKPDRCLANAHHLPEQIERLGDTLGVEVLREEEILGTGGCLANAEGILDKTDHFLVHNADLIHGIDLPALYRRHLATGAIATLAGLRREAAANTLTLDAAGRLLGVHGFNGFTASPASRRLTFSGIAFYRREFLVYPAGGPEDIKPLWMRALETGDAIDVVDCSGAAWHDFGTPQGLWEAARFRMESAGTFAYGNADALLAKPCVANEAGLQGLPAGLENVLIYEEPRAPLNSGLRNRIVGRDFSWSIIA